MNGSKISNGDDPIADVWNEHNPEKFLTQGAVNIRTVFLLMMIET